MLCAMRLPQLRTVYALAALVALSGCDLGIFSFAPSDPLLSKEAIATREAPQELVFQGVLGGEPTFLLVHDCEVFRVERKDGGGVAWTSLVKPDFYPLWTSCERQWMKVENGTVTVELGRQAFSAGGCCATHGKWRTLDGRNWKKL